jgi:hypothetical protein
LIFLAGRTCQLAFQIGERVDVAENLGGGNIQ